jgi:hypothetical protein
MMQGSNSATVQKLVSMTPLQPLLQWLMLPTAAGPQVLLTYEAVFDLKRSVDNELALLRKQKSEFGLMYTNKEVLHSLEVLEIAYGLLLLRTIGNAQASNTS